MGASGCATEGATPTPDQGSTAAPQRSQAVEALFEDPGEIVDRVPAGSSIAEIQTWEIHSKPEGISAVGVDAASGKPRVMYVAALTVAGDETRLSEWGLAQAANLHYPTAQVLQALHADMAAAGESPASLTSASLRPLDGDPLVESGRTPLYHCSAALRHILGAATTVEIVVALGGSVLSAFCGPWVLLCVGGTVAAGAGAVYTGNWEKNCD
jgi:hypothetical protein